MTQERQEKMLTIDGACQEKFGVSARGEAGRRYVGPGQTIATNPQYQPWFGFALRMGQRKYWPARDVERWVEVWEHNRSEYLLELLEDEREEVRQGVLDQAIRLRDRGMLGMDVQFALEDYLETRA